MKIHAGNIEKLTEQAAHDFTLALLAGLSEFVQNNPQTSFEIGRMLIEGVEPLAEYDFFGTEGWRHGLLKEDD